MTPKPQANTLDEIVHNMVVDVVYERPELENGRWDKNRFTFEWTHAETGEVVSGIDFYEKESRYRAYMEHALAASIEKRRRKAIKLKGGE